MIIVKTLLSIGLLVLMTRCALAAPFVPTRNAQSVAYSADGRLVAIAKSGMSDSEFPPRPHPSPNKTGVVCVWDVQTGKRLRRMETFGDITKVAFSPDAQLVAASRLFTTMDNIDLNEVRVWHVETGKTIHVFDRCHAFDFSPNGREIAVVSRKYGVVYRLDDAHKLARVPEFGGAFSLQYSPDGGSLLAVCRNPSDRYCIRRVALAEANSVRQSADQTELAFYRLAISPDGRTIATGHPGGLVLLWDAERLEILGKLRVVGSNGLQHPFFSPDGSLIGSGSQDNGDVVFWDLQQGKQLRRFTFQRGELRTYRGRARQEEPRAERDPQRFVFSPDGIAFLAGCHGGLVRLVSNGQQVQHFSD